VDGQVAAQKAAGEAIETKQQAEAAAEAEVRAKWGEMGEAGQAANARTVVSLRSDLKLYQNRTGAIGSWQAQLEVCPRPVRGV